MIKPWVGTMNSRRGFFQLWVLLTILYVGSVGAYFYSDVRGEFALAKNFFNRFDTTTVPVLCKEARGTEGMDYEISEWLLNNDRGEKLCWYEQSSFRAQYPEYNDLPERTLAERLYQQAGLIIPRQAEPWKLLFSTMGIAFLPPLSVLLVGAGLGWALAGFRHRTSGGGA
jgi:hypothetical protein